MYKIIEINILNFTINGRGHANPEYSTREEGFEYLYAEEGRDGAGARSAFTVFANNRAQETEGVERVHQLQQKRPVLHSSFNPTIQQEGLVAVPRDLFLQTRHSEEHHHSFCQNLREGAVELRAG